MHELGVVLHVIKAVNNVAQENDIAGVSKVTLEIGEVTGILNNELKDYFDWAKTREPLLANAELQIDTIEAITYCEDCKSEYRTVDHGRTCPHCGSESTYLKVGNEFIVKEIEVIDK